MTAWSQKEGSVTDEESLPLQAEQQYEPPGTRGLVMETAASQFVLTPTSVGWKKTAV